MGTFQALKLALGGKRGRTAVQMLFMRMFSGFQLCAGSSFISPWVGGISGGPQGAFSVALSGGYDDDVDLGYALYEFPFP